MLTQRDHLVGLDLAGDEANFPGELFVEHLRAAREAGWKITVHAGEAAGPQSVWQAIRELGTNRVGHAVHAVEDPLLMDILAEERIGVEANLTSNVQTSTVPDYASHPLRRFLEQGILATMNTDDPGISNITLAYECTQTLRPTQERQATPIFEVKEDHDEGKRLPNTVRRLNRAKRPYPLRRPNPPRPRSMARRLIPRKHPSLRNMVDVG